MLTELYYEICTELFGLRAPEQAKASEFSAAKWKEATQQLESTGHIRKLKLGGKSFTWVDVELSQDEISRLREHFAMGGDK